MKLLILFCLFSGVIFVSGRKGYLDWNQEYGYVQVRPGAHMFYWLFYANNMPIKKAKQLPIVIWLQGGPGGSSTGYGNFDELGPYYKNSTKRETSWAKYVNVLFIDNPVGTGFSWVSSDDLYTTTNAEIAQDLVTFTKEFFKKFRALRKTPLYIFSESYGGKMAAEYALNLYQAIKNKKLQANFKGVAMGDSWVSPIDSCLTWAPYLLNIGVVDTYGYKNIDDAAQQVKAALDNGDYYQATELWADLENVVELNADGVNFYYVLRYTYDEDTKLRIRKAKLSGKRLSNTNIFNARKSNYISLDDLMNGDVKKALNVPDNVVWGGQSNNVFNSLWEDFMKPVTSIVEKLLNETDIAVVVYNGQLDLIVDTPGTLDWVERLKWPGADKWKLATRTTLDVGDTIEGFVKNFGNFWFYWINMAGHMIPTDNGPGAIKMLKDITQLS